ncbi:MAG TPA: carboxylesterase family protein, partial [Terracidiphilus sp.]
MKRSGIAAAFVFTAILFPACAQQKPDPLVVNTSAGQIRGISRMYGGAEFLGIPYAEPPVGNLRWHEPIPAKPWTGVRDMTQFGAPCAQPDLGAWNRRDAATGREDCLFLNVITPEWPAPQKPLPVMLWLHGGANAGGTASSMLYKDGTLVRHGILLVTVNYRLSIFGFFAHPDLTRESTHKSSGNYGLEDQILALRWVRQNIAKFGGDPDNITVFGQSAGALDTGLLMTSIAKNEFQKAIAESGAAFMAPTPTLAQAEQAGVKFASTMKAPAGADAVKFLRGLSAEELLKAVMDPDPKRRPSVGPIIDGWAIPQSPARVFAEGHQSAIPLLIGVTTREFGSNDPPDQLPATIHAMAGKHADEALKLYGVSDGTAGPPDPLYGSAADQWIADSIFHCPAVSEATWQNRTGQPVYVYQFDHPIPGQEAQGAVHSADLPYVFGYFPRAGNISGKFTEVDTRLADLIENYWTNFAKTGNPNSKDVPHWPHLTEAGGYIEFMPDGHAEARTSHLRGPQCALYGEILNDRM